MKYCKPNESPAPNTTRPFADELSAELRKRSQENRTYSLRAFARDLGMAPSTLSEVLSGKRGVSTTRAEQIAKRLRLTEDRALWLVALAEASFSRSASRRAEAARRLADTGSPPPNEEAQSLILTLSSEQRAALADSFVRISSLGASASPLYKKS